MRLHFILVRRVPDVPSPILVEAFDILARRGFSVTGEIPENAIAQADTVRPERDLYILKSHTELALSYAGALHAEGARFLNPYAACQTVQNKIVTVRRLAAAGVPVPQTWITGEASSLGEIAARMPLVLKPYRGHRGAGVHMVRTPEQLAGIEFGDVPFVAQELIEGDGEDVKIYVAGNEVFAVRKPFSADSFTRPGRPVPVTEAQREIALATGRALGLGLYGIDVIEGPAGPVVVDVNYFPGYKGVPGAALHIARYIEAYANGDVTLEASDASLAGAA